MYKSLLASTIILSLVLPDVSYAWSLKTHVWIGQQVLNDVLDDGHVELLGTKYPVPERTAEALRANPDSYRMGNIGPDAFPDPIVGQTTTHPGVDGGWQTDDWLRHLVNNSKGNSEHAMALGFLSHASADIFAHTYVNAYAGDVFSLTDGEATVERRHFVLEKYIESLTPNPIDHNGVPLPWGEGLSTPAEGMRDLLIFNDQVSEQNFKAGTGVHLTAMFQVRRAVVNAGRESQNVVKEVTKWAAKYYKLQAKLAIELNPVRVTLEKAKLGLKAQEKILELEKKAYELALKALNEANEIVQKHPELISLQKELLVAQAKIAVSATADALKVAAEVSRTISKVQSEIGRVAGSIVGLACNLIIWSKTDRRNCRNKVDSAARKITELNDIITGQRARQKAFEETARFAKEKQSEISRFIDKLDREYDNAIKGISNGVYKGAVATTKFKLDTQLEVLNSAKKIVLEAEKIHDKLVDELDIVEKIIDKIKDFVDEYNTIKLFTDNWVSGIDKAGAEYIRASHKSGIAILTGNGNALSPYSEWYSCYGHVFIGVPVQVGEIGCDVKNFILELKQKFDEAIDDLPEIIRWVIFPARTAKEKALEKLEPVLDDAKSKIVKFVAGDVTGDFILLLSNPENATRQKLESVFLSDQSGKGLIVSDELVDLIDADLNIANSKLDPFAFAPLKHSVTLAKLSLLDARQLNQLIADQAGSYTSIFGEKPYDEDQQNFSILYNMVRNIDGNHQWQPYGLPHPRRIGVRHSDPQAYQFGHNYFEDERNGLRIWVDPYLREKVFFRLFREPIMGKLATIEEAQWDHYRFPECAANPFPSTQNLVGSVLTEDRTCNDTLHADVRIPNIEIDSADEYKQEFFGCENESSDRYWTIVGSFKSKVRAEKLSTSIQKKFPDLYAEVWHQTERWFRADYWVVMLSACSSEQKAQAAALLAKRRGIANDAFFWHDVPPFERIGN